MDIVSYVLGYKSGAKGGITPSGEMSITENGTYDVTEVAKAVVNVGSGLSDVYDYRTGEFTATSRQMTVAHGCGEVPDIIIFYSTQVPANQTIYFGVGFSGAMVQAFSTYPEIGYSICFVTMPNGGSVKVHSHVGIDQTGHPSGYPTNGGIRDVNSNTFTVGSTGTFGLELDQKYEFITICGLA